MRERERETEKERDRGKEKGREGEKKQNNNNTPITPSSSLAQACFYLSMTNSSFHSSPLSSTFSPHLIYCLSTASLAILE